jgi:hypothetical protein
LAAAGCLSVFRLYVDLKAISRANRQKMHEKYEHPCLPEPRALAHGAVLVGYLSTISVGKAVDTSLLAGACAHRHPIALRQTTNIWPACQRACKFAMQDTDGEALHCREEAALLAHLPSGPFHAFRFHGRSQFFARRDRVHRLVNRLEGEDVRRLL